MAKKTTQATGVAENSWKQAAIDTVLSNLEKQFWKWSIMTLWNDQKFNVETFPSGSIALDDALGGWYAKWRIVEIFWPESSWKTTMTLEAIASMQRSWGVCAFIDSEHAFDPKYAKNLGIDLEKLIFSQPDYWEQALEMVEQLTKSQAVDLIIVDSVAAMIPKSELEWDMWDAQMGVMARMMSQWLRKITGAVSKAKTTVIFINQTRQKIGVMFWSPVTTTWGNSLKFYASQRLDIARTWKVEGKDTHWDKSVTWNETRVKVIKNKVAPPFKEVNFQIEYNKGISKTVELLDIWVKYEIVKKAWAFYSYGDIKLGQGKENSKNFLEQEENKALYDEIETKVREAMKS